MGTIRSTPSSVSFWTTHSGRSPLVGANATVIAGSPGAASATGPSTTSRPDRVRASDPGPSRPPPGTAPSARPRRRPPPARRAGAGARRRGGGRRPASRTGAAGSSTNTMAAAATSTGSGPDGGRPAPVPAVPGRPPTRSAQGGAQLGEEPLALRRRRRAPRPAPRPGATRSSRWPVVEVGRGVHLHVDEQVAPTPAPQLGHAQPLQREHRTALGARRRSTGPGGRPGCRTPTLPPRAARVMGTCTAAWRSTPDRSKTSSGSDREVDEEGAVRAAPEAGRAVAGQAEGRAVVHPGRDVDGQRAATRSAGPRPGSRRTGARWTARCPGTAGRARP